MFGYAGRILRVDLSAGAASVEELEGGRARKFLGGRGLGAAVLFDEVPVGADPLGPDNRIVFASGPLAGTYAPGSGRFALVGKSPLTGVFGEAYSGGFFAHELKYAGFDGIVVQGSSATPVYVRITDGRAEIRDAGHLWGKETAEVEESIRRELCDREYKIATIGLAGENRVRFAGVINDADRAAGRTGLGAVMGAKNLKAVAVRGTGAVRVADRRRFREHVLTDLAKIKAHPWLGGMLSELGTSGGVEGLDAAGILPTRNWSSATFEHATQISGTAMKKTILLGHRACQACPIGCTRVVEVERGPFGGVRPVYGGPEYETTASFGSLCGNRDLESIAMANQLCNAYGMDTISCGTVVAFAIDCFNRGILAEKEVGFALAWGDGEGIVKLVNMIARREGIGDLLAEGTRRAAEKIGGDAPKLAVHVKGLEPGMHEPRGKKGLAISYATAPRGADHMEGFHDPAFASENAMPEIGVTRALDPYVLQGKSAEIRAVENYTSFINSIPICSFMSRSVSGVANTEEVTGMLAAATGWQDLSLEEEMIIGERNYNLARAFTVRESTARPDDRLPWKLTRPLAEGMTKGQSLDPGELSKALQEHYRVRGWTPEGAPSRQKLLELGLDSAAEALS